MGLTDVSIFNQLKKGQAETNEHISRLLTEQQRTNQLLEWLGGLIASDASRPQLPGQSAQEQ